MTGPYLERAKLFGSSKEHRTYYIASRFKSRNVLSYKNMNKRFYTATLFQNISKSGTKIMIIQKVVLYATIDLLFRDKYLLKHASSLKKYRSYFTSTYLLARLGLLKLVFPYMYIYIYMRQPRYALLVT